MGLGLVGAIGTALVYWLGGHLVLRVTFTVGTIVAFSAYLTRLYRPLTALINARVEFATSLVSCTIPQQVVSCWMVTICAISKWPPCRSTSA
jgi:ABC-type bacteriocin/lantibiotic exporter with double-glycine peptidase domain